MAAIPTILKGDDSGAISFTVASGHTYTGATLVLAYQGVTRTFTNLVAGQTISFNFNHTETAGFELKTAPLLMRLIGATGGEETVENAEARIRVTDCMAEVNAGGSFVITPGGSISDPTKVPITDVGDMATRYTLADLKAKVDQIVHVLAQRSLLSLAVAFGLATASFGDVTMNKARIDSLYNDDLVVTNVSVDGFVPFVNDESGYKSSVTIGKRIGSVGSRSFAQGTDVEASGTVSHAEGYQSKASNTGSHAEGYNTNSSGVFSHSEGQHSEARGRASHAEGDSTKASGHASHSAGLCSNATNDYSYVWGGTYTSCYDNGKGTFNIYPKGGVDGFYVAGTNLTTLIGQGGGGGGGGLVNDVKTNGVSIVANKVADIYNPVRAIVSSASVTNQGAVADAEAKYLPKTGGHEHEMTGILYNPYGITIDDNEPISGCGVWIYKNALYVKGSGEIDPHVVYYPSSGGTLALTSDISWGNVSGKPTFASVATSGSYNDLSDTPDIGSVAVTAVGESSELWSQTNTKLTNTIVTVSTPVAEMALASAKTYTDNANSNTLAIVNSWENFLDGSNVVFSITNYISGVYALDEAKLKILELKTNEYHEVYNSRDEILLHLNDFETNKLIAATNALVSGPIAAVNTKVDAKADKAWGQYTSAGGVAPSNTVYMTAPSTVFAGGLEYERVAVGEGMVGILTTKGAPVYTAGDEGTFKFQDDGGTNYFGFSKTDSYTLGCNTDGISVNNHLVTLTYNVTMSGVPCIWYCSTLDVQPLVWEQLNTPDGQPIAGASHTVSWEGTPPAGQEICYINCPEAKGFFKATVEVAGSAKFMTNMPADLSGGIMCTNTANNTIGIIRPSYNGSTVTWTWSTL